MYLQFIIGEGGLTCIRETKIPMQELELKMEGGGAYAREGGRNCGILRYMYVHIHACLYVHVHVIIHIGSSRVHP